MIIEAIFNVLFFLLLGVISLFPTFPQVSFDHLNGVIRMISLVDSFVSLRVFGGCIVTILIVYHIRVIWSAIMWVVKKLPFLQ